MDASVAIAHDYLTQRGGAERVVLSMAKAFPNAPIFTSLYDAASTYPEFAHLDVRPSALNRLAPLRRNHRLAFPLFAPFATRTKIHADVLLCSSSGWAHGATCSGRKIVYCYAPARWLYQADRYLDGAQLRGGTLALRLLAPTLRKWDSRAAHSADLYLTSSTAMQHMIRSTYGIDAHLLPPPVVIEGSDERTPPTDLDPGFLLCVARLLPYKNVGRVIDAVARLPDMRLVVVGEGPLRSNLEERATSNVTFMGRVSDSELRWLYANSAGLVAASYEDFGLSPLEANVFGKPVVALRQGGYLDTVAPDVTGVFFDAPTSSAIADAIRRLDAMHWDPNAIAAWAHSFSEERFIQRLRSAVLHGTVHA